jgi:hypothetical protein
VRRISLHRPSAATVISLIALFFAMGGTAVAATGGNFILGKANTATSVSSLTNTKGTALSLSSTSTTPPLKVSNSVQVPNLNASELDGQTSSAFLPATGTAANSSELGGLPASSYGDRWFAVVAASGGLLVGNGISSTQHDATGSYDVRFTGSIANTNNCAVFVQLMSGIGWATAGPSTEGFLTEFDVHVFNTAGNPADAQFSLYAAC